MVQIAAVLRQVLLLKDHSTTCSFKLANQHLYRCGLACAVVPEERKDLTTIHFNVEVVHYPCSGIVRLS